MASTAQQLSLSFGVATGSLLTAWFLGHVDQTIPSQTIPALHRAFFGKKLDPIDFAKIAKNDYGIHAVEYVNQFYKGKKQDDAYLKELKKRADDLGGTWRDNSYPGCACDVPSHLYSFSFAPNPNWSHIFARQREIWAYLRDCAEQFEVDSAAPVEADVVLTKRD